MLNSSKNMEFRSKKQAETIMKVIIFAIVAVGAFVCIYPLLWMLATSLKENTEAYTNQVSLIPSKFVFENYVNIWKEAPMARGMINSVMITTVTVTLSMLTASLAAFAFAKLNFPMKNFLFLLLLSSNMIPFATIMLPQFILLKKMNLLVDFWGYLLPRCVGGAMTIFFLRQYLYGVDNSVIEAAKIDGANLWTIFWKIVFPLISAAVVAQTILAFIGSWNDYMGPLLFIRNKEWYTISLVLSQFNKGTSGANNSLTNLMAASIVTLVPVLVVFGVFQKQIINSVMLSGVKM